jgi:hypothetical protein
MQRTLPTLAALLLLTVALLAGLACGDDDGGGSGENETPDSTAEETSSLTTATIPAAEATATPPPDIRSADFDALLADFLGASGGVIDPARITYANLTDDSLEDALVPVSSGGEGGDIAAFVFGYTDAGFDELLRVLPEAGSLTATVEGAAVVIREPIYVEGDPMCCPSEVRTTTYEWTGNAFEISDQQTVPAEAAGG